MHNQNEELKNLLNQYLTPKSNNQKKKDAEEAGRKPKLTKQQENAGKTAAGKKKEMQAKRAADKEKKAGQSFG